MARRATTKPEVPLMTRFAETVPEFQGRIRDIATGHGKTVEQVYGWWREYWAACDASDQSAILSEFEQWYAGQLGPRVTPRSTTMTTFDIDLPPAVADLIRRGRDETARKKREAEEEARAKQKAAEQAAADLLTEVRVSVVKAGIGVTADLAEHLTLGEGSVNYLRVNGYTTATLRLPGCSPVHFNVARRSAPGTGFGIGTAGEAMPFTAGKVGYTGYHPFDTLAVAVASAREVWLADHKA